MVLPFCVFKVLASSHVTSLVDISRREEYRSLDFSSDGLGLCIVNSECNRNMLVRLCLLYPSPLSLLLQPVLEFLTLW